MDWIRFIVCIILGSLAYHLFGEDVAIVYILAIASYFIIGEMGKKNGDRN